MLSAPVDDGHISTDTTWLAKLVSNSLAFESVAWWRRAEKARVPLQQARITITASHIGSPATNVNSQAARGTT